MSKQPVQKSKGQQKPYQPKAKPHRLTPMQAAMRTLFLSAALVTVQMPYTQSAQAETTATTKQTFNIPAGSLSKVLSQFAAESGVLLSADATLAEGKNSKGLQGVYGVEDGFSALLAGSGLEVIKAASGGYTINKKILAEDSLEPDVLSEVTILGTRAPGVPMSNVPSSISYVPEETIQRDIATSARIEDILARNVPGVHPSNVGSRTIRGRTAQVYVNGVPMNEQMRFGSGSDLNTVGPDHLASVEVSRGANSAYGFGSPGGVIALTTPQAHSETLSLTSRLRTSFNTSQPDGSFQTTMYQSASQIVGNFDYHVGLSATRDGTNYTPDGDVANIFTSPALFQNGLEKIYNLDGSFGYDLGDAGRLRLALTSQYIDYSKYYDIDGGVYRGAHATATEVPTADRSLRRAQTFNLSYENDDVLGSLLKLELFRGNVYSSSHSIGDVWYKNENTYLGVRSAITTPLNFVSPSMSVTWGVDAIRNQNDETQHVSSTGVQTGVFAPAELDMLAPYAQLELPLGKAKLSAGVRQERYSGHVDSTGNGTWTSADDGPGGDIDEFDLTLFNAGLLYALTERTDLQATFSQGAEVSQIRRAAFVVSDVDRVDAQAARSHQYEVGLRHHANGISGAVTAFYTRSRLMSSTDCSNTTIPCVPLREPRKIWGIEFSGDWKIDQHWDVAGTLTWHEGRRKAQNSDEWSRLSSIDVAPVHGSVTLGYKPQQNWRNNLVVDWRGGRGRIGSGWPYGQVEAETLVHLAADVDIGPGTLQLGVHNLFDKTYYSIQAEAYNGGWVWLPEQGRRISLGYTLNW